MTDTADTADGGTEPAGQRRSLDARIRPATAADARPIAEIRVASWRATYAGIVPDAILAGMDVGRNEAWIAERIALGAERIADGSAERIAGGAATHLATTLVVEDPAGHVAGYALLGPCSDDDAIGLGEIEAIYLAPDARGRGLGRPLLESAVQSLRGAGFETQVLWVLTANAPARRFYARAGFTPDGAARMLDFDGTPIEEIRYRRSGSA